MSDLIERSAVHMRLDYAKHQWNYAEEYHEGVRAGIKIAENLISSLPAVDAVPVVHGEWIDLHPTGDSRFMCSVCKWKENVPTIMGEPIVWDYCPSCGARMAERREGDGDDADGNT